MASIDGAWFVLCDPDRRAARDLASPAPTMSVSLRDPAFGYRTELLLRAMIIISALLGLIVLVMVFLVGFGRLGTL